MQQKIHCVLHSAHFALNGAIYIGVRDIVCKYSRVHNKVLHCTGYFIYCAVCNAAVMESEAAKCSVMYLGTV